MIAREDILKSIQANKPREQAPLPETHLFPQQKQDLTKQFMEILGKLQSQVFALEGYQEIADKLYELYPDKKYIANAVTDLPMGNVDLAKVEDPHDLKFVDLAIVEGQIPVAENGAIWIEEKSMGHRALPFIAEHLVIIAPKKELVWNMHEAYEKIQNQFPGFGVFLSGPSKTADIEQSLVIGAHGSRSLTVFLQ